MSSRLILPASGRLAAGLPEGASVRSRRHLQARPSDLPALAPVVRSEVPSALAPD